MYSAFSSVSPRNRGAKAVKGTAHTGSVSVTIRATGALQKQVRERYEVPGRGGETCDMGATLQRGVGTKGGFASEDGATSEFRWVWYGSGFASGEERGRKN